MKKFLLGLLAILVISGVWWILTPHPDPSFVSIDTSGRINQTATNPEEVLANDYAKIAANLKEENISGDEWKQINNYALSPDSIVTKENATTYFQTTQKNIPDIYSCLKKDFCGMTTRGEQDAYFDDQRTPAHILLNRNLKVMKESLRKDSSLKSQVDWEMLQELASSGSEMLSVEALDIIREFDNESIKTDELIKLTEDYKGTAKADALVRIAKKGNSNDRLLLANDIAEVFAGKDPNTVISVLEGLDKMSLKKDELSRVLKNLCKFKEGGEDDPNWKMIKYKSNKLYSDFEKNCN